MSTINSHYFKLSPLLSFTCRGAKLEKKNGHGQTPLLTAVAHGSTKCMQMLIQNSSDVKATDSCNRNIIHYFVIKKDFDGAKVIIIKYSNVHTV